jgi:hypothetical protein
MEITESKSCIVCGISKPLTDYYKHPQMGDGHLGKCKECCKKQAKERDNILRQDPDWAEKERERAREKFHRLYKGKKPSPEVRQKAQITYRAKYPEKDKAKAAVNRKKTPIGMQNHHWSYNKEHRLDTILITLTDHATAHRFMIYDQERMMYRTKEGILLDTKEAHVEYINQFINEKISLTT